MKGLADNEYYFIKLWFDLQENKLKKLFLASSGSKTIHLDWAKSVFFVSAWRTQFDHTFTVLHFIYRQDRNSRSYSDAELKCYLHYSLWFCERIKNGVLFSPSVCMYIRMHVCIDVCMYLFLLNLKIHNVICQIYFNMELYSLNVYKSHCEYNQDRLGYIEITAPKLQ